MVVNLIGIFLYDKIMGFEFLNGPQAHKPVAFFLELRILQIPISLSLFLVQFSDLIALKIVEFRRSKVWKLIKILQISLNPKKTNSIKTN